jgi:hypothetical protein
LSKLSEDVTGTLGSDPVLVEGDPRAVLVQAFGSIPKPLEPFHVTSPGFIGSNFLAMILFETFG